MKLEDFKAKYTDDDLNKVYQFCKDLDSTLAYQKGLLNYRRFEAVGKFLSYLPNNIEEVGA